MALPKIDQPAFVTQLPSDNRKIMFRPFTVREEKILLVAEMSRETGDIVVAVKQILSNCIVSEDVDIDTLPLFDLEYLFIQIRSKSVGNIVKFNIEDAEDHSLIDIEVDLDDVKVHFDPKHSREIALDEKLFMKMRYPTINDLESLIEFDAEDPDQSTKLIAKHIELVYDEDKIYDHKEDGDDALLQWIDSFSKSTMEELNVFWETLPVLRYVINYKNKLGNDRELVLEGLRDFFL
jgi:hypothetical protein